MATDYSERIGPASVALAGRPTSSTAHMAAVERADCIRQMLLDLWQLADRDGCIAAGWALEYLATPDDRIAKLQAFKAYVHARLDAAGVPTDPDGPHKAEGCRIGGRLDIVLADRSRIHDACLRDPGEDNTHPETGDGLLDRLRGIYTIPVNDGAGPLNGSMTFTRRFPTLPLNIEAATEIERLRTLLASEIAGGGERAG